MYLWYAMGMSIGMAYVMFNAMRKEAKEDKAKHARTPRALSVVWVNVTWILLTVAMCTKDLQNCSELWICRVSWWLIVGLMFSFHLGVWKALQEPDMRSAILSLNQSTTV